MTIAGGVQRWLPFICAVAIILLDALTKILTVTHLAPIKWFLWYPYGGIGLFENFFGIQFSLVYATNNGAAWSLFSSFPYSLVAFRIVLIAALFLYTIRDNKNPRWNIPLAFILAGAIANVIDFFLYGQVIDMLYFVFWGYSYPVFNIADSAIFIGVIWLCFIQLFSGKGNS